MKYLPLLWAGLWRKPTRTTLTLLSIAVAFVLFGILSGIDAEDPHLILLVLVIATQHAPRGDHGNARDACNLLGIGEQHRGAEARVGKEAVQP